MFDILQLNDMLVPELRELAEQLGLKGYKRLNKQELIHRILDHQAVVGASGDTEAPKEPKEKKTAKPARRGRKPKPEKEKEKATAVSNNGETVVRKKDEEGDKEVHSYAPGSTGPEASDAMLARDGSTWRRPGS